MDNGSAFVTLRAFFGSMENTLLKLYCVHTTGKRIYLSLFPSPATYVEKSVWVCFCCDFENECNIFALTPEWAPPIQLLDAIDLIEIEIQNWNCIAMFELRFKRARRAIQFPTIRDLYFRVQTKHVTTIRKQIRIHLCI